MKRLINLLLLITLSMNTHAQVINKGLKKVPTLVKTTSTILKTNEVRSSIAEKRVYVNNLEKQYIRMNYAMTDTEYRTTNYYDKNGYLVQDRTEEMYYQPHVLGFTGRRRFYYSDNYRNVTKVQEHASMNGTYWFDFYKHSIFKDLNNNVIFNGGETYNYDFHEWDTSYYKYDYIYYPGTTLIKDKTELWFVGNNNYQTKYQSRFEYDSLDRLIKLSDYMYNSVNNSWEYAYFTTYEYQQNESKPFTIITNSIYADTIHRSLRCDSLRWTYFDKSVPMTAEFIRSANTIHKQNVLAYDMQIRWADKGYWELIYKNKLTDIDNMGSNMSSSYNIYNNKYVPNVKFYTIKNGFENIADEYYEKYDTASKSWAHFDYATYTYLYNSDNTLLECIKVSEGYRHRYEYSDYIEISTGINNEEIPIINLYPNPNSDGVFHIDIPTAERIELYNLQGQLIRELKIEDFKIEIKDVPKGLYSLIIYTDKGTNRTKIAIN